MDLKYFIVRDAGGDFGQDKGGDVEDQWVDDDEDLEGRDVAAFLSFMPTMEDGLPVIYLYEVHLQNKFQG